MTDEELRIKKSQEIAFLCEKLQLHKPIEILTVCKIYEEFYDKISKLEKENEELKNLIEIQYKENQTLGNNNTKLLNMFGEAKAQIEKMKRCNNCEFEDYEKYYGEKCNFGNYKTCGNWELRK